MGSAKRNPIFTALTVLGVFLVMVSACKNPEKVTPPAVQDINVKSSYQEAGTSTADEIAAARAGLGCVNNADQPAMDSDAKATDTETRSVETTRGKDILTSVSIYNVVNQSSDKLIVKKSLLSYSSAKQGEMMKDSYSSTLSCDPKLPLAKACGSDLTAKEQSADLKKSMTIEGYGLLHEDSQVSSCRIPAPDSDEKSQPLVIESDDLGNYQMHNTQTIKVVRHVKIVTGQIVCHSGHHVGHGSIREETLFSRDLVGIGELVGCGGVQVVRAKTVFLDTKEINKETNKPESKVIFSQRTEILDSKMKTAAADSAAASTEITNADTTAVMAAVSQGEQK